MSPGQNYTKNHVFGHRAGLHAVPAPPPSLHIVRPEGQLQVHTAAYRGSFAVVLSEALRAAGLGRRVMVAQFLKGGVAQGPKGSIHLCGRLEWLRPSIESCLGEKAEHNSHEAKKKNEITAVEEVWEACREQILEGNLDQLVLDEVGLATYLGYLNENDLINTLEQRPGAMDVILTGPSIPSRVIEMADQFTELRSGH